MAATAEHKRLEEAREKRVPWRKWGPYLSERQWGTVREDYSELGNAWEYFSHDQARSREEEFLSPYGIRSISKYHRDHPYVFAVQGQVWRVGYEPAESQSGLFGGNSNWRGPVWFPINALLIRALLQYDTYFGDDFTIECPTGSGRMMNLSDVAKEIATRLTRIFLRDADSRRPVYGGAEKFQTDPHWKNHILFYEYFHGDNGAGLGASHQTGWTGLVACLIQLFGAADRQKLLESGIRSILPTG